jgi:hypothetical protein
MNSISSVSIPINSEISKHLEGAHFSDSYSVIVENSHLSALEIYLNVVSKTPAWIERLMSTRNRLVGFFGLKNLGNLGSINASKSFTDYCIGDRVGIFTIYSMSEQEVIFADSDKHLNAKVSVCKTLNNGHPSVAVSTVVHIHNKLGHLYMLFVAPVHRLIVPAMLKKLTASHPV